MTDAKTQISEFVEDLLTLDQWDPTPAEATEHILKLLTEAGWQPPRNGKPVEIETREWVITGEQITDDPAEFAGTVFVRHNDLPEIWAALRTAEAAPSTQDETEYGVRLTNGTVLGPWGHAEANGFMSGYHPYGTLMQRHKAGPWVSVSSVEGDKEADRG